MVGGKIEDILVSETITLNVIAAEFNRQQIHTAGLAEMICACPICGS